MNEKCTARDQKSTPTHSPPEREHKAHFSHIKAIFSRAGKLGRWRAAGVLWRGHYSAPLLAPPPSYRCVAHNGFGGLGGSGLSPSAFNCELPLPLPLEKWEVPRAIVSFSFLPDGPKKAIPQYFPCCSSSPLLFSKQDISDRPTTINPFSFPDSSLTPCTV